MNHAPMAKAIHQDNIAAGWWQQIPDGSKYPMNFPIGQMTEMYTVPRNIGELLCLIHSELSESWEGYCKSCPDDKLPQYPMFQVEIADTAIRAYDVLGYYHALQNYAPQYLKFDFDFPHPLEPGYQFYLLTAHQLTSTAMEGFRKSDVAKGLMNLSWLLDLLYQIADEWQFDLPAIIEAKREFNRNRADHKPENRVKDGGKKF